MAIVDEDKDRVRDSSDIVQIVSQYVHLKREGTRWVGLCPFHAEKSGSFKLHPEQGRYYCFGCHKHGDVIDFVQEIEHLDFVGALEWLAHKAGITLRYTERGQDEGRRQRSRLTDSLRAAVAWYHERLNASDAGPARAYLRSRGFDAELVKKYQVGWAPGGWDELVRACKLSTDIAQKCGLGYVNKRGRLQDAFRNRILFPIFDPQGDPVGFGGRNLPGADGPKYKNSSESPIYAKSKVLYGLNWAKTEIVAKNEVVICEGYTDVIGLAQAGVGRAVATCGTALTEQHLRLLKKFAHRIVLAFDADEAGQGAAERYYAWEKELELDVAVADLPAGQDPADLARTDPEALVAAIDKAKPFLGFRVERALRATDVSTPEGRARGAQVALQVISEHPNELVRDQYLMTVADQCRIDHERLRQQLGQLARSPRKSSPNGAHAGRSTALGADRGGRKGGGGGYEHQRYADDGFDGPASEGWPEGWESAEPASTTDRRRRRLVRDTPETEALRLAIHQPEAMAQYLTEELFADEVHLAAFVALIEHTDLNAALDVDDPDVADLLGRLAVEETDAEPADVLARLAEEAADRELRRIAAVARNADDPMRDHERLRDLQLALQDVRNRSSGLEAVEHLLALLATRGEGQR